MTAEIIPFPGYCPECDTRPCRCNRGRCIFCDLPADFEIEPDQGAGGPDSDNGPMWCDNCQEYSIYGDEVEWVLGCDGCP